LYHTDIPKTLAHLVEKAKWAGLLYSKLAEGKRQVGRPKLRFKDNLKSTLKISVEAGEDLASNRSSCGSLVNRKAKRAEQRRTATT